MAEIEKFAEELQNSSSLWLFYHQLRMRPDLAYQGPHGISNAASATEKSLAEQIAKTMKRAYWDSVKESLNTPPPELAFLLERVAELLDTMAGFLPESRREAFIRKTLDFDLLKSQVENNAFDHDSLLMVLRQLAQGLMSLESVFQSEKTEIWLRNLETQPPSSDFKSFNNLIVDSVAYLFEKCDILKTEVANYQLQKTKVKERQNLERYHFVQMLKSGAISMDVACAWLRESGDDHTEIAFIHSFIRLLRRKSAITMDDCPEPLRCDLQRLQDFQSSLQGVALLGLAVLLTSPLLPKDASSEDVGKFFEAIWLESQKAQPSMQRIKDCIHDQIVVLRRQHGVPDLDHAEITKALESLEKCLGEDVPAFRLLHDRTLDAFQAAMGPPKRDIPQTALGEKPLSMKFAVERLSTVVNDIWSFAGDHLQVYKAFYKEALHPSAPPSPSSGTEHLGVPVPDVD
eukprot:gnl/MRDRNA2_/MRDRNA2_111361_c0_seq1.p1 gnl/MRDRNA2_/MRDRNA2_111361_c0~~gnl/MRDRNA2_/MRDRNA2_111361_c0_seq1.p1  ORF type:complete len:540 (+),score=118.78 gnl/MRDRNA2_/MRDRNA2_111361_c0_seq1:244-1620(+)